MKIEQQKEQVQSLNINLGLTTNSKIPFKEQPEKREAKLEKREQRDRSEKGDISSQCERIYKFLESLILAQDERWRRA